MANSQDTNHPEVVKHQFQLGSGTWVDFENAEHFKRVKESGAWPIRELITLQSHRDVMVEAERKAAYWEEEARRYASNADFWREQCAKKDAALQACVEAMETCTPGDYSTGHVINPSFDEELIDAAITQAQEAQR